MMIQKDLKLCFQTQKSQRIIIKEQERSSMRFSLEQRGMLENHYCTMLRMCLFLSSWMKQRYQRSRRNMMLMLEKAKISIKPLLRIVI